MTLPDARTDPAPGWPLTEASDRETELWEREWKRPQAVMWERNSQELEVAMYVRSFVAAEKPDASTNARTLIRQQQEALGISLPGLARNHWRIENDEPIRPPKASSPRRSSSAKSRFKVLDGGAA